MKKIKLSRTGVTHAFEDADMTICARSITSAGDTWTTDPEVTCKQCLRAVEGLREHCHVGECHELCEVHPKPVEAVETRAEEPKRQFCRKGIHDCIPAVTLTFDGGARRLHWCAEHASDADGYRAQSDQATKTPVETLSAGAAAQADGVRVRRAGKALMGNCSWSGEVTRQAFVHGWMTLHESCDCKESGGIGYTFDLATHTMVKNPPARQYTRQENERVMRKYGFIPASWRSKHKGSKAIRIRSHA